ncbi:SH3 domain-containing protein, partial [Ignavibacteria bacterium 4148-Me]|uniref:SH3 domain-containing protein n=1 Tax=Rosettibacter primus TaxID=3111523 RepID=UPI00336BC4B7
MNLKFIPLILFIHLQLFLFLEAQNKFSIGDKVKANATLNVRSGAGTSYMIIFQVYSGDMGVITGGSNSASGYYWYKVRWDKNSQEGWSVQDGLDKVTQTPAPVISSINPASPIIA